MDKPHRLEKKRKSKWESVDNEVDPKDLENVLIVRPKDKNKQIRVVKSVDHYHEDKRDISSCVLQSEVFQLEFECLPTWTLVLVNKLPQDKYKDKTCVSSYLLERLERNRDKNLEGVHQKGSHEWIAWKLCKSSVALYTKQGSVARKELDDAKEAVNLMHPEVSIHHRLAYKYLIESLDWTITELLPEQKPKPIKGMTRANKRKIVREMELMKKEHKHQKNHLTTEWKQVFNQPRCASALIFVKGCLGQLIGEGEELLLKRLKMARDYEPDFYLWEQLIYEMIRKIRKAEGDHVPGEDEIKACENAYQLCQGQGQGLSKAQVTLDWAMMRKERFKHQRKYEPGQEAAAIVRLFRNVISDPSSLQIVKIKAHILMAEMYTFREAYLDAEQGNQIFMECLSKYPKDSEVLHKVGKFYHYGLAGGKFQNLRKAEEIYAQALTRSPANYPCLMDYMKMLGKKEKAYNQIIDLIDKYRNYQIGNPMRMSSLLTIRGLCYWIRGGDGGDQEDKRKAVEEWLDAVTRYPMTWAQVSEMITAKENDVLGNLDINLKQVTRQIRRTCRREEVPKKGSAFNFYRAIENKLN